MSAPADRFPLPDTPEELLLALRRPLVAVLPFAAPGEEPALRALGAELAARLRARLASVPALRAILISSDFIERAPEHALELICRQLAIGHLFTGRCYPHPQGASLYLELADTREWNVQWAYFCRGRAGELFTGDSPEFEQLQIALQAALRPSPV